MDVIRLLLVDDHYIIRDGIKIMLKKYPEFEVIAEASTGLEAINYLETNSNNIDITLMDINMPNMNGIEATKIITNKFKNVKVLGLTMYDDKTYMMDMLKAGAMGYILKESNSQELIKALKTAGEGEN